jgi:hypothetical protein
MIRTPLAQPLNEISLATRDIGFFLIQTANLGLPNVASQLFRRCQTNSTFACANLTRHYQLFSLEVTATASALRIRFHKSMLILPACL